MIKGWGVDRPGGDGRATSGATFEQSARPNVGVQTPMRRKRAESTRANDPLPRFSTDNKKSLLQEI